MNAQMRDPTGPKRSRPDWIGHKQEKLSSTEVSSVSVVEKHPTRSDPSVVHRRIPTALSQIDARIFSGSTASPVEPISPSLAPSFNISSEESRATKEIILPNGEEPDAVLLRRYMQWHRCSDDDLSFIKVISDSLSSLFKARIELLGSQADGSASLKDSLSNFTFGIIDSINKERVQIFEDLKAAGYSRGWTAKLSPNTANVILIYPLSRRDTTVYLVADSKLSALWYERTNFAQLYSCDIEPRICVAICLIREWLLPRIPEKNSLLAVDYLIFSLLWRCLTEKRVIPTLLESMRKDDGIFDSDKRIWLNIPASRIAVDELRASWRLEGIAVAPRASLIKIIGYFIDFSRNALNPENDMLDQVSRCPLNGLEILDEGLTCSPGRTKLLYSIWRGVCSPFTLLS